VPGRRRSLSPPLGGWGAEGEIWDGIDRSFGFYYYLNDGEKNTFLVPVVYEACRPHPVTIKITLFLRALL